MWKPNPNQIITPERKYEEARTKLVNSFKQQIQSFIDMKAREKEYESAISLATYVNSTIPKWVSEAQAFISWRDQVWLYVYNELNRALNGERDVPTPDEFLQELPVLIWPDEEE